MTPRMVIGVISLATASTGLAIGVGAANSQAQDVKPETTPGYALLKDDARWIDYKRNTRRARTLRRKQLLKSCGSTRRDGVGVGNLYATSDGGSSVSTRLGRLDGIAPEERTSPARVVYTPPKSGNKPRICGVFITRRHIASKRYKVLFARLSGLPERSGRTESLTDISYIDSASRQQVGPGPIYRLELYFRSSPVCIRRPELCRGNAPPLPYVD